MEKIPDLKEYLKNEMLNDGAFCMASANSVRIAQCIDKINEIVDWINKHERIMVKDKDWLLARLKMIEEGAK